MWLTCCVVVIVFLELPFWLFRASGANTYHFYPTLLQKPTYKLLGITGPENVWYGLKDTPQKTVNLDRFHGNLSLSCEEIRVDFDVTFIDRVSLIVMEMGS